MKNKILFTSITFLTLALGVFTSCEKVKEFESVSVTSVPKLYEPVEDRYAVIEDVSNLYFEWEKAQAEDNSVVYYDILFDKPLLKGSIGFQNAKGNILTASYDSEKRITIGYAIPLITIKR